MTYITIYINFKFNNERCCCDYREMQLTCVVMMMRDFFDFSSRDRQGFLKTLYAVTRGGKLHPRSAEAQKP